MSVRGRDVVTGYPRALKVSAAEVRQALAATVKLVVDTVLATLDRTPPELASDIVDKGLVVTGGTAQLPGLGRTMREATGLPVIIADDPASSVAVGAGRALTNLDLLASVAV